MAKFNNKKKLIVDITRNKTIKASSKLKLKVINNKKPVLLF